MKRTLGFSCPCCGNLTRLREEIGTYDICPVCGWQDDSVQFNDPTYDGGANEMSLNDARANYKKFGAKSPEAAEDARKPFPEEIPLKLVKSDD
jgi:hypothetical protein